MPRDSVLSILGQSEPDTLYHVHEFFPTSGLRILFDDAGRVSELLFLGTPSSRNWIRSSSEVVFGVTAADSLASLEAKLGPPTHIDSSDTVVQINIVTWRRGGYAISAHVPQDALRARMRDNAGVSVFAIGFARAVE